MTDSRLTKNILAVITAITLVLGVMLWVHPPAAFPDPSWGFQAMRSLQQHKGFNLLISPTINDVSKTSYDFLSWWSPGQYLVPYLFMCLFQLNIGKAIALTVTMCALSGIYGFFAFFKKVGFTPIVSAISIAFICIQQAYFIPYVYYNGGEILLFAFAGWFLYGCTYFQKASLGQVVFVLLSGLIGFFCKSSFLWIYFAGTLYLWIRLSLGKKLVGWLANGIFTGLPAVISLTVIYLTYLSKGGNPSSGGEQLKLVWETFGFPLASPLLAGFSLDDLSSGGILAHPIWILILLALASISLTAYLLKVISNRNYRLILLIFYTVCVIFFGVNFLRQANISYEARHMRLLGLIITPGIIAVLATLKAPFKIIFGLVGLYILFANYGYVLNGYKRNAYHSARASSGLAQEFIDQPTLNYITALDSKEANAIFVFISPDLPLEAIHNRTITLDPLDNGLAPENEFETFSGHAGALHIILPKAYDSAKVSHYINSFPGYHDFVPYKTGNDYIVYTAK